jgi:predicted MPP superfamily phosphohydrolase
MKPILLARKRFLKILAAAPFSLWARPAEKPLFSFIYCNDLHISDKASADFIDPAVRQWRSPFNPADFIVIGGDIGDRGVRDEFIRCCEKFDKTNKPYYPVMGNHDHSGPIEFNKKEWRSVFGSGRENYFFVHKGIGLIFLDLCDGRMSNVTVPEKTVTWLAETLKRRIPSDLPLIVFTHFPLHPDAPEYVPDKTNRLHQVLDTRKVLAYFSGHWHGSWHAKRGSADYFGNTCMALYRQPIDGTDKKGYLQVKVFKNKATIDFNQV